MTTVQLQVPPSTKGGVITIGNFDGVHRGHQQMLSQVCQLANQIGSPPIVVTFDPHPINVLKPDVALPRLTTIETRRELLTTYGANEVVVLPVSRDLLAMSPEDFFSDIIVGQLQASGVVEGPDFRFGKDRRGDVGLLQTLCEAASIPFVQLEAVNDGDEMISSTSVRRLLQGGSFADAIQRLGHPYRLTGTVVKGAGRGRDIGFPTANLADIPELIPADGVYAAATVLNGERYPVAVNIGSNPTFDESHRKVECHLPGYNADLYGARLSVDFLQFVRGVVQFGSIEELKAQIDRDVSQVISVASN